MDERALTREPGASAPGVGEPSRRFRGLLGGGVRDERGTAVVEFALVALPLFLIVFGILDFGRALNYYNDLTQLAGQGARAAAVNTNVDGTPADGSFQQKLWNESDSPELRDLGNPFKACVDAVPTGTGQTGQPVTVRTEYQFHFIPLVSSATLTLHATQTVRFEGVTTGLSTGCYP